MVGMTERAPLDIKSYSDAYLQGKLDRAETDELIANVTNKEWSDLFRRRQQIVQQARLQAIKAKNREQLDLSDVVALLVMLVEK